MDLFQHANHNYGLQIESVILGSFSFSNEVAALAQNRAPYFIHIQKFEQLCSEKLIA